MEPSPTHQLENSEEKIQCVHSEDECYGICPIHHMTEHIMRSFPQHWRDDRRIMERICPHGIGHPDPDHLSSLARRFPMDRVHIEAIHGCDGCCIPPKERREKELF